MNSFSLKFIGRNEKGARFKIEQSGKLLSFSEVLNFWKNDKTFTIWYIDSLNELGFDEYFWEHPALKTKHLDKPYELVVLKSDGFARREVNETAFAEKFNSGNSIEVFPNLGKNAMLVVPAKEADSEIYKHLGSFLRFAPMAQRIELFRKVAESIFSDLSNEKTVWLSTAGMGVIWLHVRLDSRPKYYRSRAYLSPDFLEKVQSTNT